VILGTAGHIDHGKSTLVTALTGIDPDRLAEEKRRGMTIDLGFAHMRLPDGQTIGLVDVPGHARFIRNMLAGAQGIDAVLLVVAADEGVMPQTREHLEIIDLLEVRRGLVALTKVDLVDEQWLSLVKSEVASTLEGTSIEGAKMIPVSATTGKGLDELKAAIGTLFRGVEPPTDRGRPRLPVDRVFTMSGFGTVVTGTLVDGRLAVGDELEVLPQKKSTRIRGLQQHNESVSEAAPGSRVAANVIGIDKDELSRGDVLARPATLSVTRRVDALVRVVPSAPRALRHGAELLLHTGTAEVGARVIVLESDSVEPGAHGWVQLYLARAIAVAEQDRFVLRVPSPSATLAGGRFADVSPRRHPRHDSATRESLERRAAGDVLQEELRKYPRGVSVTSFLKAAMIDDTGLAQLRARRAGDWLFAAEAWSTIAGRARTELDSYHSSYAMRRGMAREELRSRLGLPAGAFGAVVKGLAEDGALVEVDGDVALPSHRPASVAAGGPAAKLVDMLSATPFAPPSVGEAMRASGADAEMVRALVQQGDLVRLSDDTAFTRDAYEKAVTMVKELIAAHGSVTVAQVRDRLQASRRPVLALLEHLDSARVTRRVGDARVLR
jgi:selenocysteine-specific elongation factor